MRGYDFELGDTVYNYFYRPPHVGKITDMQPDPEGHGWVYRLDIYPDDMWVHSRWLSVEAGLDGEDGG